MTNNKIANKDKNFLKIIMIISTFGGLLFGYDTGVVNGALPYMEKPDQLNLTPFLEGFVVSALLFGAALGSISGGRLADKIGRRTSIICFAIIFFVGAMGCTLAPNAYIMISCRFILGLAVGGASVTVPTYLAEISPTDKRGRVVTQNELMIVSGQFFAFICNAILGITLGETGHVWRYMLFLSTLPAIVLFFGMLRMPESPRWLAINGKVSVALTVLEKIRKSKELALAELNEIEDNVLKESSTKQISFKSLSVPWVRRIVFIGMGIAIATRFTGVNTIMFYGTQILTNAGFSTKIALVANMANGLTSVAATFLGIWLLGKIGRKTLFLLGFSGTTTSLLLIALFSYFLNGNAMLPFFVLLFTILFLTFMQGGIGPVLWLSLAEIFPARLRGLGMGLCVFVLWLVDFCIGTAFPVLLANLGLFMTFMFFVVSGILAIIFVIMYMPETKDKSLEEIEKDFRNYDRADEKKAKKYIEKI